MDFIKRMEALMKEKGISNNSELSKLCGIPYTTIDGFYKKGVDNIKLTTLQKLSDGLGCTMDYLATGENLENPFIIELLDVARGCDPEDVRFVTEQLRRLKLYRDKIMEAQNVHPDTEKR